MSKNETPMTRKYWKSIGGTLIEEFMVVKKSNDSSRRLIDGLIILRGKSEIAKSIDYSDINNKDIIVVQTKNKPLSMTLLGQVIFSKLLIENNFSPKSVRVVALCTKHDQQLQKLIDEHFPYIEVEVMQLNGL